MCFCCSNIENVHLHWRNLWSWMELRSWEIVSPGGTSAYPGPVHFNSPASPWIRFSSTRQVGVDRFLEMILFRTLLNCKVFAPVNGTMFLGGNYSTQELLQLFWSILQASKSEMLEVQAGFDIRQQCSEVSSWWSSALSMQQWRWEHGRQGKEAASSLKLGSKQRSRAER